VVGEQWIEKDVEGIIMRSIRHIPTNQDSEVGIATSNGLDNLGVWVQSAVRSRIFSTQRRSNRVWGTPSSYTQGTGLFPPGVKRPGRETDDSPPTSAEVKETCIYTHIPPYVFMA
jgi:hypothetical protein